MSKDSSIKRGRKVVDLRKKVTSKSRAKPPKRARKGARDQFLKPTRRTDYSRFKKQKPKKSSPALLFLIILLVLLVAAAITSFLVFDQGFGMIEKGS